MVNKPIKVLLIEDNSEEALLIQEMLTQVTDAPFYVECVDRLSTALARLAEGNIDVILLDLALPDGQGLDTFARVHAQAPRVPVVVLTGLGDETLAVKTLQKGAQDYLVKAQADSNLLVRAIRYAVERQRIVVEH